MEVVRALLCVLSVFAALVSERFAVLAAFSQSLDSDFTFTLPAGRKECFYQTMKKDASLEIEYQVINTFITGVILFEMLTLAKEPKLAICVCSSKSIIVPNRGSAFAFNIKLVKPVLVLRLLVKCLACCGCQKQTNKPHSYKLLPF